MARFTLLVLVALLAAPGTAFASFVELRRTPSWTFSYTADPGETNALTVTKGDGYRVRVAVQCDQAELHLDPISNCPHPLGSERRSAPE